MPIIVISDAGKWVPFGSDGVDDTVNLQAALDTGKQILLTSPNYVVDGTYPSGVAGVTGLIIPSGARIKSLIGSTITLKATTNPIHAIMYIRDYVSDIEIEGINFVGIRTGITGSENGFGLHIRESDNVKIKNCTFTDFWTDGIYVGGSVGATNLTVENCIFTNCYRNNMSLVSIDGATISNCRFLSANGTSPQAGVDVEPNSGYECTNIEFINCEFSGNTGPGLYLNSGAGGFGATNNIVVTNCIADDNAGGYSLSVVTNVTFSSCLATNNTIAGFYAAKSTNISLNGCNSIGNSGGVAIEGGSGCGIVGGSYSDNTVGPGIRLRNSSGTSGILGTSNSITGATVIGNATYGIQLTGDNYTVIGNTVHNNLYHGIYLTGAINCSVIANSVIGNGSAAASTYHGIYLVGSNYNNVQSNTIRKSKTWSTGKTAVSGSASTIVLDTSEPLVNGYFDGQTITITGGTGSGLGADSSRIISSYIISGTGPYVNTATVTADWTTPPDNTSTYTIGNAVTNLYSIAVSTSASIGNFITNNDIQEGGTIFDGGTATVTVAGNNVILASPPLYVTGYPISGGVVFTRVNSSYIRYTNSSAVGTGDFTMMLDITPLSTGANQGIAVLSPTATDFGNASFYISLLANDDMRVTMFKDGLNLVSYNFTNFAVTYSGQVTNLVIKRTSGVVSVYINGTITTGSTLTTGTAAWADSITGTYSLIGMVYSLETFGGIVHNYSLVNKSMTDDEIARLARGSYYDTTYASVIANLSIGTGTAFPNYGTPTNDGASFGTIAHMKPL